MYDNLDGRVLVVDERVEPRIDELVERDPAGDERLQIDLAFLHESDRCGMIADVGDGAAEVNLLKHEFLHVDGGWLAPDRHVDDYTGRRQRAGPAPSSHSCTRNKRRRRCHRSAPARARRGSRGGTRPWLSARRLDSGVADGEIEYLIPAVLHPLQGVGAKARGDLVAEAAVNLAFLAQTDSVDSDQMTIGHGTGIHLPAVGSEQPRPADNVRFVKRQDPNRARARRFDFQRDRAFTNEKEAPSSLPAAEHQRPRGHAQLLRARCYGLELSLLKTLEDRRLSDRLIDAKHQPGSFQLVERARSAKPPGYVAGPSSSRASLPRDRHETLQPNPAGRPNNASDGIQPTEPCRPSSTAIQGR